MKDLSSTQALGVKQVREWTEILTDFEAKNKYVVYDNFGNEIFKAAEEKNSFLLRTFLKASRPFTISLMEPDGQLFLKVVRPFRWFFAECDIVDKNGKNLGKVKWEFSVIRKKYSIQDSFGNELYKLHSPALKPWTFYIMKDGTQVGQIQKKWTGILKEAFTDADNFGVEFNAPIPADHKAIILGSVFLIDFKHFEDKK